MTGEISFNLEDAEFFLTQLQQLDETLKQEWSIVFSQWENLRITWNDEKFSEFEELFEELSSTYKKSEVQCEQYIKFITRKIDLCEQLSLNQAIDDTNKWYINGITTGLPPFLAFMYACTPGNSWAIRNLITNLNDVKEHPINFNPEAARKKLSNVFVTTALGDQGELATLNKLIDEFGTDILENDNLWDNNKCRQENLQNRKGESIQPDFYLPSKNLICDAKAYKKKSVSKKKLREVINKYANALDKGGEVRLYFPKDTYQEKKNLFDKLENEYDRSDVKVKIQPMKENHSDLKLMRNFLYNYFKLKAKQDYKK